MICVGVYQHQSVLYELLTAEKDFQVGELKRLTDIDTIHTFDLLLIEVKEVKQETYMPILKKIQEMKRPKVIILKKSFTLEEVKMFMRIGVYDCVEQPVDRNHLITAVHTAAQMLNEKYQQQQRDEKYMLRSVRESLAYDLLHGRTKNAKEIWERSQLAKLSLIPNNVLLVSIDDFSLLVKNKGEVWKNTVREEVLQGIQESLLQYESLKVLVNQNKYAILLALPVQMEEKKYRKHSINCAEKIREGINLKTPYTVTIGIGNYYEDARNLHLSFQESEQAQSYRLYSTENSIIHFEELDFFETLEYDHHKLDIQEITDKFALGDIVGVYNKWKEIYHSVETHPNFEPEEFRLQVLDLLFSLTKVAIQNGANPKSVMPLQIKYAKDLYAFETLAQIDSSMQGIIESYNNYVNECHNEESLKSVQEVMQYVEDHYNRDIGLEEVAEQVELSPNYVSTIFKQTTGSSFTDYVTNRRMKEAKQLLKDLNMTIYKIANYVGYSSPQYFSRVFKNHIGLTPSQYRNSILTTKKW